MKRFAASEAEVMCLECGWTRRVRAATATDAAQEASQLGVEHRRERHGRRSVAQRGATAERRAA